MSADTRLAVFLSDIGAAELSSRPSDAPLFARHRARLEQEIQAVQLRIHRCLQEHRLALERQSQASASLTARLQSLRREVQAADQQLHDPATGLKTELLTAFSAHADLEKETLAKRTFVSALETLEAHHGHLSKLKGAVAAGQLDQAVDILLRAESQLMSVDPWMKATQVWKRAHSQLADQRTTVEKNLGQLAFGTALVCSTDPSGEHVLTILSEIVSLSTTLSLKEILHAMDRLSLLEKPLLVLLGLVFHRLVDSAVSDGAQLEPAGEAVRSKRSATPGTSPMPSLLILMRYMGRTLLPNLPVRHRSTLMLRFTDPVCHLMVDHVLLPSLPASLDLEQLKRCTDLTQEANRFETEVQNLDFDVSPIISGWIENIDRHWSQKVGERVVHVVKEMVVKAKWDAIVVTYAPTPKPSKRNNRNRQRTSSLSGPKVNGTPTAPHLSATTLANPAPDKMLSNSMPSFPAIESSTMSPTISIDSMSHEVDAGEDDAWGFDEEAESTQPAETPHTLSTHQRIVSTINEGSGVAGGDEGWGFGEEEAESPTTAPPELDTFEAAEDEEGAWGFVEGAETPIKPDTHHTESAATSSGPVQDDVRPTQDQSSSIVSWAWDEEDDSPRESTSTHPKARSLRQSQLRSRKVNGITTSTPIEPLNGGNLKQPHENFSISASTRQVLQVAMQLLADAKKLHQTDFPHIAFARAALLVQDTCLEALDYFRATMAVQHAHLLQSVPALGMQFANDCDWLAGEIVDVDTDGKKGEAFLAMAKSTRAGQLAAQRAILSESLDEAGHFRGTSDPARFAACQRAMRQITYTLERLSLVWKPPSLTQSRYNAIMGELVNGVLSRVLSEIEDQADISESDSKRLNELCKMLHPLEALFEENEKSMAPLHVPLWFKFEFLSELLEASLVDIMFLFDEGHLVDFSTDELIRLIRALFSDSQARSKAIDNIRAHRSAS